MTEKPTYEELEKKNRELKKPLRIDSPNVNQDHYRKILDCSPSVIYSKDLKGRYTSINKQFENLSGLKSEDVIGKTDFELFPPSVAENSIKNDKQVIQTGMPKEIEEYGPVHGNMHTFISTKYPLVDEGGKIYGICGVSSDITERASTEKELQNKDKLFRTAITHSPIAMVVSEGIDQTVIMVNDRFTMLFGYTKEDIPDVAAWWLLAYPDETYREKIRTLWTMAVEKSFSEQSQIEPMEVVITCKDGTLKEVSVEAATVGKSNLVAFVDMTERKQVERELKKNQGLLSELTNQVPGVMYQFYSRPDGKMGLYYVSDKSEELLGLKADLDGFFERFSELIMPEYRKKFIQSIEKVTREVVPWHFEGILQKPTGERIWFAGHSAPSIRDTEIVFNGIIQDITERKQAEEILYKSHEMLKRTEAMANIGSWEWDVQGDRAYWSEELFRIFGLDPADGAPSFAEQSGFYVNEDMRRLKDAVENCVKRGQPYEIEVRAIRIDGEIRHCISRGLPQYDESGKVFQLFGSFQDITERKRMELALKESEERFKALHNASFGGIAIHEKGIILECNMGLSEITGYGYDELIGMDGLQLISDDTREKVVQNIEAGYEKPYEVTGVRKSGELYPLRLEARNIPYKGKKTRVVEFRDISEIKRAEQVSEELEGKLRQAQKMEAIGRLAGGVAHDFNNMLNVIIGHAEMAMEDVAPSHTIYDRLKEIRKAGKRSAELTRQLLAFARKQTVSPKVLNFNKTLGDMTSMLHRLMGENIDLVWRPGNDVWPVKVDPSQIDQILANLCVNARDAITDVGKVTIETSNVVFDEKYCSDHPEFNPGEYVHLAISDNGCGIDSETLDNIFEPFFTTKESGRGTGLGLATVYGVVKQNNGFINVNSEVARGTTFNVYLPRYSTKAAVMPEKEKELSVEQGHETILLVEDEIAILRMTEQMLKRFGYQVITAKTPGEGIRLAQQHAARIHLLITDVIMPEMNGRDLAKNILSFHPNLKRLFMSGYTANVIAHHGVLDEGVNFIQKPFSKKQLGMKLREMLDDGND